MNIVLASTSPRRVEMLSWLSIKFMAVSPKVDELKIRDQNPEKLAIKLAEAKAMKVATKYKQGLIIGSDTVIDFEGSIVEKPVNIAEQRQMMNSHLGKTSTVITAVTIIDATTNKKLTRTEKTQFTMAKVSQKQIEDYIKTGKGLDKGGGFGIQDENGIFVSKIKGCYTNNIGFPLCIVAEMLEKHGVKVTADVRQLVKNKIGEEC